MPRLFAALACICVLAPPVFAAPAPKPSKPSSAPREWANAQDAPLDVIVGDPPKQPVLVELGRRGKPYRVLPANVKEGSLAFSVPPKATVQLWNRNDLAGEATPLEDGARWGALPRITVGTVVVNLSGTNEKAAWQSALGRFRAFPEGLFPVTVSVRNEGAGTWKNPRVRLFAPDDWQVSPDVAVLEGRDLTAPKAGAKAMAAGRGIIPGGTATATFRVRIPKSAAIGATAPLAAFLRFDAGGRTITAQNSVDVTVEEPMERRYSMNEAGTKFIVRLTNRFSPSPLGNAGVEVRAPSNAAWSVTPPGAVSVEDEADAIAKITPVPPPADSLGVPVVVTLNGYRMGATPLVYVLADYVAKDVGEKGLARLEKAGSPFTAGGDGLCATGSTPGERMIAFDVAGKFAVSEPSQFLSPTWVTVTLDSRAATRIRLEYDAWGKTNPTIAGDIPIPATGETTATFVLPDAHFTGGLPGGADFRLVITGGSPCIRRVTASKWNPERK